jgi:hypothetical protein
MKLQIAADADNKNILRIAVSSGKTHDFKMLKESRLILPDDTLFVLDKAYQGIFEIHPMSLIPIKATKNHKLTPEEKAFNSFVSKLRIFISISTDILNVSVFSLHATEIKENVSDFVPLLFVLFIIFSITFEVSEQV